MVWLVPKHPPRLGMQLKYPVYKKVCTLRKLIVLSAVAALAVSLSQRQNAKSCDGSDEERASEANKARGRLEERPYLRALCGSKTRSHPPVLST